MTTGKDRQGTVVNAMNGMNRDGAGRGINAVNEPVKLLQMGQLASQASSLTSQLMVALMHGNADKAEMAYEEHRRQNTIPPHPTCEQLLLLVAEKSAQLVTHRIYADMIEQSSTVTPAMLTALIVAAE